MPPRAGLRASFRMKYFRPVWRYKTSGAEWTRWSPFSGAPFVSHGILLNYRDGLRAIVLAAATGGGIHWHFAAKLAGEQKPLATSFYVGPWNNRNLFKALAHAIQTHFRERRAPYPVERTLLVTGILDAEMESRFQGGQPMNTPHLAIGYTARDYRKLRERGASWKIITQDVPEPKGIEIWKTK